MDFGGPDEGLAGNVKIGIDLNEGGDTVAGFVFDEIAHGANDQFIARLGFCDDRAGKRNSTDEFFRCIRVLGGGQFGRRFWFIEAFGAFRIKSSAGTNWNFRLTQERSGFYHAVPGEKRKRVRESPDYARGFTVIGVGFERGDAARMKKPARSDVRSNDKQREDRAIASAR